MRLTEITYAAARPIDGYGPGFFRVDGQVLHGACRIAPQGAGAWGGFGDTDAGLALAGAADVVLVGTGAEIAPLPPAFRAALEGAGLGLEVMNSPAACRTYNILLAEGRRIAALLLPV